MKRREPSSDTLKELKWVQEETDKPQTHVGANEKEASGCVIKSGQRGIIIFGDEVLVDDCREHPWECECVEGDVEEDPWPLEGGRSHRFVCICAVVHRDAEIREISCQRSA